MYLPNSEIRLISGLNLDNSYEHTLYFNSKSEQVNFFYNKSEKVFNEYNTVRDGSNTIRLKGNSSEFYNYSYMMFKNSHFTDKWFYAFITNITYINENTTEINFDIDVIQTWYFDIIHYESFIEREHVKDDTKYKHTMNEGFDNLPIKVLSEQTMLEVTHSDLLVIVYFSSPITLTDGTELNFTPAGVYGGSYVASYCQVYPIDVFKQLINVLQSEGKVDSIITAFLIHQDFVEYEFINDEIQLKSSFAVNKEYDIIINENLDGYIPRNNKLYQYPYNYSSVLSRQGTLDIKYQFIDNPLLSKIRLSLPVSPQPVGKIYLQGYRGIQHDYESSINFEGFPLAPYNYNMYINEFNANRSQNLLFGLNSATQLATSGARLYSGDVSAISGVGDTLSSVTNKLASLQDMERRPHTSVNQSSGTNTYLAMSGVEGLDGFDSKGMNVTQQVVSIRHEYAKMVDKFFDKYGYRVMRHGLISYKNRQNYTYVKTVENNFIGNFDVTTKSKIKSIFNDGITFWVNANVIGNYDIDNSVLGG